MFYRDKSMKAVTQNVTETVTQKDDEVKIATATKVYMLLKEDPTQTRENLAIKVGKTARTIQRALDKLSGEGRIKRIGSSRAGYWEVF